MPRPTAGPLARLALLLPLLGPGEAPGQDGGRDRIEREAAAQAARADALLKEGKHAAALTLYRAERASRKAVGDARYEAYALRGVGCCLAALGDDDAAVVAFAEAREIDAGREDRGFTGYDGLLKAQAEVRLGRAADAAKTLERAVPDLGQAVDRDHECDARIALASARLSLGEPERAAADAARALALAEELDDPRRLADSWLAAGIVDRELGRLGLALDRIHDARDAYRDQGRAADAAKATRHLADLSYRLGNTSRAARRFEEAAEAHAKLGDTAAEADCRLELASVRLDLGDPAASAREAARARDGFLAAGDDPAAIEATVVLAQAQSATKDGLGAAAETIRGALARADRALRDAPAERVRLLLLSAELEHRLARPAETTARLDQAGKAADRAGDEALRLAVDAARARLTPEP